MIIGSQITPDSTIENVGLRKIWAPSVFCWCVWSVCFTWMVAMISVQGARYPWSDEWNLVPYLANARPITWQWLWAQHVDHRIPMVKLVYLILYQIRPGDFRLPIFFNAILMGAASALLMRTVSKLRGRASYADVFLPLIMMHMGLGMSWWGFQIQFVLPTFLLCVIVAAWSSVVTNKARTLGVREALVITLAMVFLPLCGTNGLVLSAGVILFSALVVSWYYRSPGKGLSAVGMVFAGVVITLLVDALYFVGFAKVDHHWGALTASSFLRTTVGVILAPFGVLVSSHYALTLGVVGVLGGGLLLEMLRSYRSWEPNERRYIFGLIVLSVSAIAVALTVGYGRAGRGWMPDLAWHYAVLVLPSYAGVYLLMSRMRMSKLAFMVCILVAGIYCENLPGSVRTARDVWLRTKVTDHALTTSLNVDGFVESQVSNLYFVNNEWVRGCVREGVLAFGSQGGETSRGVLSKYNKFADR